MIAWEWWELGKGVPEKIISLFCQCQLVIVVLIDNFNVFGSRHRSVVIDYYC